MVIFHYPLPIEENGTSGSQIRPRYMLNAFRQLGYQVEVVAGYARERQRAISHIKNLIRMGCNVAFIYSESSTMPTLLTEPHHLPIYPFLDFGFFKWAKQLDIPIGLFYRDVFWRFSLYRKRVPWIKRAIAIPFYHYDWLQYTRFVDHLFLPSLLMKRALPGNWPDDRVSALPPGCEIHDSPCVKPEVVSLEKVRLLYVGGVTPPLYDLRDMVSVVRTLSQTELTIICRVDEWRQAKDYYGSGDSRIKIVHASGEDLKNYYYCADLFIFVRAPYPYLDFAMPVKMFEALGFGLPIITNSGTAAARFIEEEDVGWVVSSANELRALLAFLTVNPNLIAEKRERTRVVRKRHTWLARASQVVSILDSKEVRT